MKIESLALGDNIQNPEYISDIRDALLGLALNMCKIYQQESQREVQQLIFPFLQSKTNQRMYFFITFLDDIDGQQFKNRLYTNIVFASQFKDNDPFKQFELHICHIISKGDINFQDIIQK